MSISYKRMSVGLKIIVVSAVLAAIFLGSTISYLIYSTRGNLIEKSNLLSESDLRSKTVKIESLLTGVRDTVLAISNTPPFQGIIRANNNNGYDELGSSSIGQWEDRLSTIFVAQMESARLYDQMRYLDDKGNEKVRVNFENEKGKNVSRSKLQYKGGREYFKEAIKIDSGDIFVSKLQLNREGSFNTLSEPYKPVIRFAVPIFDKINGERKGVFVANVLFENLLERGLVVSEPGVETYIVDSGGYFIFHPDSAKEWGSPDDLNTGFTFGKEFPGLNESFSETNSELVQRDNYVYVHSVIPVDSSQSWIVINRIPKENFFGAIDRLATVSLVIGLVSFFILLFVFILVVNRILYPLKEMKKVAEAISQGDFTKKITVSSGDEIGDLAKSFNKMSTSLQGLYSSLEEKVNIQTEEVKKRLLENEDIRKAVLNILEDVQEDKDKLAEVSRRLELATKSAKIGVWEWDIVKDVLKWDDAMYELYRIEKSKFKGAYEAWRSGLHPDDVKSGDEAIQLAIKGEKDFDISFRIVWPSGEIRYIKAHAIVEKDAKGAPKRMVGVNWDITKEAEVDRAKTEFVSLASHQLRTPLSTVNWYTEMLLSGDAGELKDDQVKYLKEIYQGNQRMVELVNSLLNVSRLELGMSMVEPEPTSFVEVAQSVINEQMPQIENRKIKIETSLDKNIPTIQADPKLLRMVFQNLLSNSVKYTREGGEIKFRLSLEKDRKNVLLTVADNGMGIPQNQQKEIFKKLFRADNVKEEDTEGTGLGLYIIKSVIEQSGGRIWFESPYSEKIGEKTVNVKGTKFYVTLPVSGMKEKKGEKSLS